jgi:hypothetical protein
MQIREPLVHATYYYLREAPGDSPARRQDRHEAFVTDTHRVAQSIAGWLSMPAPALPRINLWEADPPPTVQPLMETNELRGQINAAAWLRAYALRNMLLLRVIVMREGEHEPTAWALLDAALGTHPATPSYLQTTRYWCGFAPRLPEDLEAGRLLPVQTPFGVLCLGVNNSAHVLVYPDARSEQRANHFLRALAPQLDWYPIQARYRLEQYQDHAARAARNQQQALDHVAESVQYWAAPTRQTRLGTLLPLQAELDAVEKTYDDVLADMKTTRAAAQEVRALMAEYRLTLMQSGLWDAAPTIWEAQVAGLSEFQARIEADADYIDATLRRMELMMRSLQTRMALLHGERERLLVYLVTLLGVAGLAVLIADTDPALVIVRLLALVILGGIVYGAWRLWLRVQKP